MAGILTELQGDFSVGRGQLGLTFEGFILFNTQLTDLGPVVDRYIITPTIPVNLIMPGISADSSAANTVAPGYTVLIDNIGNFSLGITGAGLSSVTLLPGQSAKLIARDSLTWAVAGKSGSDIYGLVDNAGTSIPLIRRQILDWATVVWPNSATNRTYNIGPYPAIFDVIDASAGSLISLTPRLEPTYQGDLPSPRPSLVFSVQSNTLGTSGSIIIQIDFQGVEVTNLRFKIFNVDRDTIPVTLIKQFTITGQDLILSAPQPILTAGGDQIINTVLNRVTAGTASYPNTGAGSASGVVYVRYPAPVRFVTIEFKLAAGSNVSTSAAAGFGISNIQYDLADATGPDATANYQVVTNTQLNNYVPSLPALTNPTSAIDLVGLFNGTVGRINLTTLSSLLLGVTFNYTYTIPNSSSISIEFHKLGRTVIVSIPIHTTFITSPATNNITYSISTPINPILLPTNNHGTNSRYIYVRNSNVINEIVGVTLLSATGNIRLNKTANNFGTNSSILQDSKFAFTYLV
jgi:hypothetical protein